MASLNVVIIGGGVGGLSSAIALRRSGHQVTVYEKLDYASEIGAGVTISPNVGKCLNDLGFDHERARGCLFPSTQVLDGQSFELQMTMQGDIASRYSFRHYTYYRPDLQKELKRVAEELGCHLISGQSVIQIDVDKGHVVLADGADQKADLIVASNGIHSKALDLVLGEPTQAQPTNITAVRFILPTVGLRQTSLGKIIAANPGQGTFCVGPGARKWLLTYWCQNYESINFVVYSRDEQVASIVDQASRSNITREDVKRALEGFHPDLIEVCDHISETLPFWRVGRRKCVNQYSKGRLVVIGDAAHALLPHIGLGANNAILDGAALGALFRQIPNTSTEEVARRLQLYDKVRVPRVCVAQTLSDVPLFEDPISKQRAECAKYMSESELPKTHQEMMLWTYTYDVVDDCRKALQADGIII